MIGLIPLAAAGLAGGGLVHLALILLFFCAFCAIIWIVFQRIAVPEPLKTIIMCVLLLIGLAFLWQVTMGGGGL